VQSFPTSWDFLLCSQYSSSNNNHITWFLQFFFDVTWCNLTERSSLFWNNLLPLFATVLPNVGIYHPHYIASHPKRYLLNHSTFSHWLAPCCTPPPLLLCKTYLGVPSTSDTPWKKWRLQHVPIKTEELQHMTILNSKSWNHTTKITVKKLNVQIL
jgi:hypothetical protein